ncbi:hypothetical protein [Pandoraea commovens]|uniref:Uncharacterized protein n=1 Tax=Pandoraea commovens TaxID=2508289 RepID=A0A5E4VG54_9BURK|nr:hypothetical protein [Pandoraea commovens]VVE10329.1 hypothetical protein PCO31010_02614 [Pandoraea commovens]
MSPEIYFDPALNLITADPKPGSNARVITKAEVPDLVRAGAEVDKSARDVSKRLPSGK